MKYNGIKKIVEMSRDLANGVWIEVGYNKKNDEVVAGASGVGSKWWTDWNDESIVTVCYIDRKITKAALIKLIESGLEERMENEKY